VLLDTLYMVSLTVKSQMFVHCFTLLLFMEYKIYICRNFTGNKNELNSE